MYIYIYIYIYLYIYIYIGTQSKCTKRWKQSSAIKQLLETLFLAIKMCTDFTTDVLNEHNVSSAPSEPSQGSSRNVSSFKDSSALLNN